MKSSLIRSLCAIAMGLLLIEYREQTVTWLTIAIGVLFLVSGIVSCASYLVARRKPAKPLLYDSEGRQISGMQPSFPIVGVGSLLFGIVLMVIPNTFVAWLMYIMAAILILGAISQYVSLVSVSRFARVGLFFWIMPSIILLIAIITLVKPTWVAATPLLLLGWCMIVYGVVETISSIKLWRIRKAMEKRALAIEKQPSEETTEAEEVE